METKEANHVLTDEEVRAKIEQLFKYIEENEITGFVSSPVELLLGNALYVEECNVLGTANITEVHIYLWTILTEPYITMGIRRGVLNTPEGPLCDYVITIIRDEVLEEPVDPEALTDSGRKRLNHTIEAVLHCPRWTLIE